MKKISFILLSLCLIIPCFLLAGCGSKEISIKFNNFIEKNNNSGLYYEIVVENAVNIFDFNDYVELKNGDSWTLSSDISGVNVIPSKVVQLSEKNNIYYVVATLKDKTKCFKLNVYRNAMFTVSFNTYCSQTIPSINVEENKLATEPTATINRTGFDFVGWDFDFTTPIKSSITINAIYNIKQYNIEYVLDGGTQNSLNPEDYTIETLTFNLFAPSKYGYTFDGWYDNQDGGNKIAYIQYGSCGDKTLYARWSETTYYIYYHLNEGTNNPLNIESFTVNSNDITLYDPTKYDHDFDGWYKNASFEGEPISLIEGGVMGSIDLYAKWSPVMHYTITYYLNDGTNDVLNPNNYCKNDNNITLLPASRDGYEFLGWFDNVEFDGTPITTIYNTETENKNLYAKWKIALDKDSDGFYKISTINHLLQLGQYPSYWTESFRLYNDIDLQNAEWTPIGNLTSAFSGEFDGNNYSISNLKIIAVEQHIGFFGYSFEASISNLILKDISVICENSLSPSYYGTLLGIGNYSLIENCSTTGTIEINITSSNDVIVGGLCASVSEIKNSYSNVNIDAIARSSSRMNNVTLIVGGLCGSSEKITNSYSVGEISASIYNRTQHSTIKCGGLVGQLPIGGEINYCYSTCDITTAQPAECDIFVANYSGTLVGASYYNSTINHSFSSGSISCLYICSQHSVSVGKLIGLMYSQSSSIPVELPTTSFGDESQSILVNGYSTSDKDYSPTSTLAEILSLIEQNWDGNIWDLTGESFPTLK